MKNQRGGTFLGFILGLIIGLAVAMVVAVYVARVPIPFINKSAWRTNDGQNENEKNRDWDPNTALRGRGGVRPVPPSGAVTGASEPAAIATRPTEVAVATEPRRPGASAPARAPAGDPLGEFAAARVGAQAQPATAAGDQLAYFVQAGAFRAAEDAEAQRARLLLMGVQARVSTGEQAGRTVYRVRVGPMQNKDAADRVKERLDGNGFAATLVRASGP